MFDARLALGFLGSGGFVAVFGGTPEGAGGWLWNLGLASVPMKRVSVVASNALPIQASP
jgi:hypothetical protein